MPKNVMKLLKRSASHARNSFDLSHRHLLSANFGELLPVTCIETVPGDYIELRVSDLLRAMPMVTSPFMRVKQHFDVWFTPYEDLWSNFEPFMVQKYEPKHGNNYGGFAYLPHINTWSLQLIATGAADTVTDVVGRKLRLGAQKLLDLLGYGRIDTSGSMIDHPDVNLFRLAQYNKIWYEEYRQNYYDNGLRFLTDEDFKLGHSNPAVIFNFDDLTCDTVANSDIGTATSNVFVDSSINAKRLLDMLQMRYRCWKKDLFTGLMPSTQFGNVSTLPSDSIEITELPFFNLKSENEFLITNGAAVNGNVVASADSATNRQNSRIKFHAVDPATGDSFSLTNVSSSGDGISVLDLRKSEAIQIWRERALTAGNRVSDNLRAHYGDDVDYNDHRSTYLGSVDAPFNISDINATAQTGETINGVLGDVAGKGISSLDEKVFKFKAKKFGCIMVMFSLLPEAEYESNGIDRMNQLIESEDFFVNEYQDLGLEAVSSMNFYATPKSAQKIIGYAPRYYGYKQKLDKCFGQFKLNGIFAPWASPKTDVTLALASGASALPLSVLYVNPALYNGNFAVDVDNSDQVICDVYFDVSAVRQMSLSGLPNF